MRRGITQWSKPRLRPPPPNITTDAKTNHNWALVKTPWLKNIIHKTIEPTDANQVNNPPIKAQPITIYKATIMVEKPGAPRVESPPLSHITPSRILSGTAQKP